MKKFMKIMAFAMAMTLVFGMTVSAAESVTTEEEQANFAFAKVEAVTAAAEDGTVLEVQKAALTGEQYTAAQTFVASATIENAASKSILAALDVSVPSVTDDQLTQGVTVTFAVPGVRAGGSYVVFHQKADGTWEQLAATIADGSVSATFYSFSPVVVVEVELAASNDNGGSNDSGSNDSGSDSSNDTAAAPAEAAVSPKTGEMLPAAGIMAVICLAGASFCAVKVRKNQ